MPYQANIPQPSDVLSDSQADLLGNFSAIKALIDVNHVTFDVTDQGKHASVVMPTKTPPVTGVGEVGLFCGLGIHGTATVPELYFAPSSAGTPYSITSYAYNSGASNGSTTLPSGIKIIWGQETQTGLNTIAFPFSGFTTTCFGVILSPSGTDTDIAATVSSYTKTNLTLNLTARTTTTAKSVTYTYIAFGV